MNVLIIKTTSLGDLIHTLPALTDAGRALPQIKFDWVAEDHFAEVPRWHPLVEEIIPVAVRRWRKKICSVETAQQWAAFRRHLRAKKYDLIIDAQGLTKSALLTLNARGPSAGLSFHSARDPFATLFYRKRFKVSLKQHAVLRMRSLFSQALGYALPNDIPDYGIDRGAFKTAGASEAYVVFLHGTTWATKHWPESYWIELAKLVNQHGLLVKLPWGSPAEQARAHSIAQQCANVEVLPRLDLKNMATVLATAQAIVAVDTGLGHLAAALNVPTVSLYGPTDPQLTGALGASQVHLTAKFPCAPCFGRECRYEGKGTDEHIKPACFGSLAPQAVWAALRKWL